MKVGTRTKLFAPDTQRCIPIRLVPKRVRPWWMSRDIFPRSRLFSTTGNECGCAQDLFERSHVAEAGQLYIREGWENIQGFCPEVFRVNVDMIVLILYDDGRRSALCIALVASLMLRVWYRTVCYVCPCPSRESCWIFRISANCFACAQCILLCLFVCFACSQEMQKRTPSVIELDHLIPGKEVRVTVNVGESGQEREAYFTTPYGQQADWKIAT